MKILKSDFNWDDFVKKLQTKKHRTLMLDFDGTLSPFTAHPSQARYYPGVREILSRFMDNPNHRLVFITGRTIESLLPLVELDPHPEIWGAHGWEFKKGMEVFKEKPGDEIVNRLHTAAHWVQNQGLMDHCEIKPTSINFHWRALPEALWEDYKSKVLKAWTPLSLPSDLALLEFDGGVELRALARNKGSAVRAVLATETSETARAFLGDDKTDEDGFQALQGRGLSVLVKPEFRETHADIWIQPPEELLSFLKLWLTE